MIERESHLNRTLYRFAVMAVICLAVVAFMGKAYQQSLQAMDSSYHARLALQATANGLKPVVPIRSLVGSDGSANFGFNDHPFTLFYLEGWVMRLFGADAWSARLLPSLFAVGCIPLTLWLGTLLFSPLVGLAASFVLTLSLPFISYGARFQLDHAMIFFILLSFVAWVKRRPLWMGVAAGLGMWMKNPVAFLVFPSAFLSLAMIGELKWREFRRICVGFLVAVVVGGSIWFLLGMLGGWGVVADYWNRQVFGTAVGGRGYSQEFQPFLFLEALKRRYWPWLPLLIVSLVLIVKNRSWRKVEIALPLSATLVVLVSISAMRFKFDHYYLPMYPFVALLTIECIRPWLLRRQLGFQKFVIGMGMALPCFFVAMPVELSPEMFPALKRFDAIIQSYGSCKDKVLFIEGEQPYGGPGDYGAEVLFYANRSFEATHCHEAVASIDRGQPEWILVFGENRKNCLREDQRSKYTTVFKYGNQYLLTRNSLPREVVDLTPLARELRAPLDCEPPALPQDRYHRYD